MKPAAEQVHLADIAQIAFTVSDLAVAKAFYAETLGMTLLFEAGTMAFFQCGTVRLVLAAADQPAPAATTLVYFRVPDIAATHAALHAQGVPFAEEPHLIARMKSHDLWIAFLKDPSGNSLGLMSEVARS